MKIVAFSDIHGNQYAFEKFLEQLKAIEYDALFFCGDIHGYYYGQSMIVEKLQSLKKLYAVKGNHDKMAIDVFEGRKNATQYFEKYGHSYAMLEEANIEYVRNLPERIELKIAEKKYAILHGTPGDELEGRLYPDNEVENKELYQKYDFVFCGHTHCQMVRTCGNAMIINAGSVGQQRDGKGFCFMYFDTETRQAEYKRIHYDMEPLEEEIRRYDSENEKLITILHRGES